MTNAATTKLALIYPVKGTGELVDTSVHLEGNWKKLDEQSGARICTSGTRPGVPYQGQVIFETDTGAWGRWNGTEWLLYDSVLQSYVPVWTALGGGSTNVGSTGALSARYARAGKMTRVFLGLQLGGTGSLAGTGVWKFTLPFVGDPWHLSAVPLPNHIGSAWVRPTNISTFQVAGVHMTNDRQGFSVFAHGASVGVGGDTGFNNTGILKAELAYQAQ